MSADRDISRLPVWGQRWVRELQGQADAAKRDLADYKARETAGLADSTVIADPYSECPIPLGSAMVNFTNGDISFKAEFEAESGVLMVTASASKAACDGLAVYPSTGNCVRLKGGRAYG